MKQNTANITGQWHSTVHKILNRLYKEQESSYFWQKYQTVFSSNYQNLMPPRYAVNDIFAIEKTLTSKNTQLALLSPGRHKKHYRLHFYSLEPRFLDEYFPVLGNLNLRVIDQVHFPLTVEGTQVFIKSFTITATESQCATFTELKCRLLEMIRAILNKKVENDPLNSLLILTGLNWQEIDVLRAYRNYYLQLGNQTTLESFHSALIGNPEVAQNLFYYFHARFTPDIPEWEDAQDREEQALFPLRIKLLEAIESVADINHDRILRTLFNLMDATVRSNFHVRRDLDDYFIAFKINSLGVIDLPTPRPINEIYVHAYDMEGIHLRGGKISRGGIRWSDRIDDFRTEILGLMQTQMSKNVLIIPKGAKGGFIVKHDCSDTCFKEAGKQAYIKLIQGLLDLTDNYIHGKVIQLPGIISYDDPDPYLVVAADKGTAQFSDLANSVAAKYYYWLGDAFASGGSKGYNHKQLGITARGAWESVKRHFRELGKDIQQQPFSVIGIGSMDGDVFGNGMLLSEQTKLMAAISGTHIFIDPEPADLKASFIERKRLFELPGSSWDDYDRQLISEGGGIFRRDAKVIQMTQPLKKWLGLRYNTIDGETLIQYLLRAPVELLWLGGIGSYVKSSEETHGDVGDRDNDSVRIDAINLRASVVGEGANLGFTQKARIEYDLSGGHINTDAVDNSAGVDISDHEVNLKILLQHLYQKKRITDYTVLFTDLTEPVCHAVLNNNYQQTLCLSMEKLYCSQYITTYLQLADQLEASGYLDKKVESFAQAKNVLARQPPRLTRPELAALMAASKMYLTELILEQHNFLQAEYFNQYLLDYFPPQININYPDEILSHPLAREIKATCISNKIINQSGFQFLQLSTEYEDSYLLDSCLCYLAFDQVLAADQLRQEIYALDNKIETEHQYSLLQVIETALRDFCRWSLINEKKITPVNGTIDCYKKYLREYQTLFEQDLINAGIYNEHLQHYKKTGASRKLAKKLCFIESIADFPYLVTLTEESKHPFSTILSMVRESNLYLGLNEIYTQLQDIQLHGYWEEKICLELQNSMKQTNGELIRQMLKAETGCSDFFATKVKPQHLKQYQTIKQKISTLSTADLMPYIALKETMAKLLK